MTYLKTILIGLYEDLISKYDGAKITDSTGTLKFKNGKVYSREYHYEDDKYFWKEYNYKILDIEDLILDLESITEQLQEKHICIIGFSINNTEIL